MERVLAMFGDPNSEVFMLEKVLHKEFKEPFSSAIIVCSPKEMTLFSLSLRRKKVPMPPVVELKPQSKSPRHPPMEKGKGLLDNPPPQKKN